MTINIDDEIKKLIGKCLIVFEIKKHVICNNDNEHNVYNIKRKGDCIIIYYRYIDQDTKCYVSDYISLDKKDFVSLIIGRYVYGKDRMKHVKIKKEAD